MEKAVKEILYNKLKNNLNLLGSSIDAVSENTDLLKAGIIDSMEFIELLAEIGQLTGTSIEDILNDDEDLKVTINWFLNKFQVVKQ